MITVLIPLLLASPALAEDAGDDDFSFLEEGEQNRKKFEADRAPAANIFLPDDEDEDDLLPTWDASEEDSGNIDDDEEFDFDLPSDLEAGMGLEMDPVEDMEGLGPDLNDRVPLGNHFPLVISQSDLGATVAELPVLVARNPQDLNGDLWVVADVYLDGLKVGESRHFVSMASCAPLGPTYVWIKATVPVAAPSGVVEMRVFAAPPGKKEALLFVQKAPFAL
jgi:hypothetical protein